ADARPSDPYFLRDPRDGDLYRWPDDPAVRGLPMDPPLVRRLVTLALAARAGEPALPVVSAAEVPFVGVDQALGEYREPVLVVPALSVATDQATMAWPLADAEPRSVSVRLRAHAAGALAGRVRLEAPAGWRVEPASVPFEVEGR